MIIQVYVVYAKMKLSKLKQIIKEEIQKLQEQSRGIPCYVCVANQSALMDNLINFPNGQVAQEIDENGVFGGTFTPNMSIMGLEPGVPGPQGECGIFLNDMEYSGMYISVTGAYDYTNINYDIAAANCHPPVDPCANLEQHAISLGMQSGVPGVDGTTMTATDQFCIKCQATLVDPMCDCCNTDYTYNDNIVTYNPDPAGIPPKGPSKDLVKNRMKKLAGIPNKSKK